MRTESLSAASKISFICLTNIYPALAASSHGAEARNSAVIKGSLALCSHEVCNLEVRASVNQIIKDDYPEGKGLGAARRITTRKQLREKYGRNFWRKPSHTKQAVTDDKEEEEAPASVGGGG